jgi:tetratricopeptide (TPR) repeat protein
MDETKLLSIISKGESTLVDFKRQLRLDTARDKRELVKDVISIANSNPEGGYLLIGVEDDGRIVGIEKIDDEQIQQICHTYISPPAIINTEIISISRVGFLKVGVIFIHPTNRPHQVAKTIENIEQNAVFVRRGSIITKATPEEMFQMHSEDDKENKEITQLVKAAERHNQLKNYESSIAAYSRAIEIKPTADIFIARANVYNELIKNTYAGRKSHNNLNIGQLEEKAMQDLGYAIELSKSTEQELATRKMRRSFCYTAEYYTNGLWWEDFEIEKNTLSGPELGEFIFNEFKAWDSILHEVEERTFATLYEALDTGYQNPELLFLIAEANNTARNYSEALKFVNKFIESAKLDEKEVVDKLLFKSSLLIRLGHFLEAKKTLLRVSRINKEAIKSFNHLRNYNFWEELLIGYVLAIELDIPLEHPATPLVMLLAMTMARQLVSLSTTIDSSKIIEWESKLDLLEKDYPGINMILRELFNTEQWERIKKGDEEEINFLFPSLQELAQEIIDKCHSYIEEDKRIYITFVSKL